MTKEQPKEKVKKNSKFFKFIYFILFISCTLFTGAIYYLNVLPLKYFLLVLAGSIVILGLFGLVLLKKRIKKVIKIFFSFLAIVLIAILVIVSKYTLNVKD